MAELSGYRAARQGAVYYLVSAPGYIEVGGEDRIEFLHRQTSNDMHALKPGSALRNVLTSANARIIDVFWMWEAGEAIQALTLPGRGSQTADFLRNKIFFGDQVSVSDRSAEYAQILLAGPQASRVLETLGFPVPAKNEITQGDNGRVLGQPGIGGLAFRLILPQNELDPLTSALADEGAVRLDESSFEILRVEAGLPGENGELTGEYTPLETGLRESAISIDKGCYTGQEVIARQINYDKVVRKLVGLELDAPVPVGTAVRAEGRPAGTVTSRVTSPRFGEIALAVLKRPYNQEGTPVDLENASGRVMGLPFRA